MKSTAKLYHVVNRLRLRLKARAFRGNMFYCSLCGFNAKAFLPSPDGERPNVRCPRCDSLERHRAQWTFGLQTLPFTREQAFSVLHVTPEFCITDRLLSTWPRMRYRTAMFPQHPFADYCFDVQRISLPSESVDVVICNHILEHVPDDRAALDELYRVIKTGGFLFVQVPFDANREITFEDPSVVSAEKRRELFGQEDHVRVYGADFAQRPAQAGFSVTVVKFWETMSQTELVRQALTDREPVYICRK